MTQLRGSGIGRTASSRRRWGPVLGLAIVAMTASGCIANYNWLQFGGGSGHTGSDTTEATITFANVGTLHRVWQATLTTPMSGDGSPIYLGGVDTPTGKRSLVFVTTLQGSIFALDAHTGEQVWVKDYPRNGCTIEASIGNCFTTSSPAVDPNKQFVYVYGLDFAVHKLAVGDGTEVLGGGWPEVITLKGNAEKGSSSISIATAQSGVSYLYLGTSGYPPGTGDMQGHLVTVNLTTGDQHVFNTVCSDQAVHFVHSPATPDCPQNRAGLWARAGTMYDAVSDRLLIAVANGTFDPTNHHWGDSVLALHPDGTPANAAGDPLDSYTPTNFQALQDGDLDLGSTLPAILPPVAGSNVARLAVQSGKDGKLRLLNLDDLSGQGAPGHVGGEVAPIIDVPQGHQVISQPAVWTNPADGSAWVFVTNNVGTSALEVVVDGGGNPTLAMQWKNSERGSSPLVVGRVLFVVGGTRVAALNANTGANLWQDATLGPLHWQAPMVDDGTLFVEDGLGHVNAYRVN